MRSLQILLFSLSVAAFGCGGGGDDDNGTNGTNGTNGANGTNGTNGTNGGGGVTGALSETCTPGEGATCATGGEPCVAATGQTVGFCAVACTGTAPIEANCTAAYMNGPGVAACVISVDTSNPPDNEPDAFLCGVVCGDNTGGQICGEGDTCDGTCPEGFSCTEGTNISVCQPIQSGAREGFSLPESYTVRVPGGVSR